MRAMTLTEEEISFLESHGLCQENVYVANIYETRKAAGDNAKLQGKELFLGSSCGKSGHRLRTRSNHCWQCDPKQITFQRRHEKPGFVYVAGSMQGEMVKIGFSEDRDTRILALGATSFANENDWILLLSVWVSEGANIERQAQEILKKKRMSIVYAKDGRQQETIEVFKCTAKEAMDAIAVSLQKNKLVTFEKPYSSKFYKTYVF